MRSSNSIFLHTTISLIISSLDIALKSVAEV
jgi:hypothetical protein